MKEISNSRTIPAEILQMLQDPAKLEVMFQQTEYLENIYRKLNEYNK